MIADRGCAKRGCACYDSRIDGSGVEMVMRKWVGLTDEEITDLWSWAQSREAERCANTGQHAFARAIEAKLKEKNFGMVK